MSSLLAFRHFLESNPPKPFGERGFHFLMTSNHYITKFSKNLKKLKKFLDFFFLNPKNN